MSNELNQYLAVQRFVTYEALLLDEGKYPEWLTLFAAHGIYWMPLSPDQREGRLSASLIYDDAVMRELRCQRWLERNSEGGALSLQPSPRSMRHLSQLSIDATDGVHNLVASGNLLFAEFARGSVLSLHARVTWRLAAAELTFKITEKRVDLLNADSMLSDILSYL